MSNIAVSIEKTESTQRAVKLNMFLQIPNFYQICFIKKELQINCTNFLMKSPELLQFRGIERDLYGCILTR